MQKHLIRDNILYTGASAGIMIWQFADATGNTNSNNIDTNSDSYY